MAGQTKRKVSGLPGPGRQPPRPGRTRKTPQIQRNGGHKGLFAQLGLPAQPAWPPETEPRAFETRGTAHHNRPAEDLVGHVFQNFLWIPFGDHPLKLERYRED